MNILQFRLGGEYRYNVTFETAFEKRKIQTNDEPTGSLPQAVSDAVIAAVSYFGFENINAVFRQISFSYPENDSEGFVLELDIKSKENPHVAHILKTEKMKLRLLEEKASRATVFDNHLRIEQHNSLVEKIEELRDEIAKYAQGKRNQKELPFEDSAEEENGGAALFDDDGEE
jgi:uncharacterized protein YsxB (DUF464 family)